jgi:hypothetical protein
MRTKPLLQIAFFSFLAAVALVALAGRAQAQTPSIERAEASRVERPRLFDVGLRPLFSLPDAVGIAAEIHPFGGKLTVEGGVGMSPIVAITTNLALKYRFLAYSGEQLQLSIGPGIGWHWLFEKGAPVEGQLLSVFAAAEAVWWIGRTGFRLALDAGVSHPIGDGRIGAALGTLPMLNSTIGMAFRL